MNMKPDLKNMFDNVNDSVNEQYDRSVYNVLDRLGLEPKREPMDFILPAIGIFGAGIAVGASLGVLFAPKRGEEIRSDIRGRLDDLRERSAEEYEELREKSEEAIRSARERTQGGQGGQGGNAQGTPRTTGGGGEI